ncbi:MAG: hypothetical protein R2715_24180 [Ilumatobacteraceae bacterium]
MFNASGVDGTVSVSTLGPGGSKALPTSAPSQSGRRVITVALGFETFGSVLVGHRRFRLPAEPGGVPAVSAGAGRRSASLAFPE